MRETLPSIPNSSRAVPQTWPRPHLDMLPGPPALQTPALPYEAHTLCSADSPSGLQGSVLGW